MTADIERGDNVIVTTASGQEVAQRAITGLERGQDFVVVWVCSEHDWATAVQKSPKTVGIPWPAEAVRKA